MIQHFSLSKSVQVQSLDSTEKIYIRNTQNTIEKIGMAFNPRAPLMVLMKATYLLPPFSAQWIPMFRQNVLSFRHAKVRRPSTGGLAFNLWVT